MSITDCQACKAVVMNPHLPFLRCGWHAVEAQLFHSLRCRNGLAPCGEHCGTQSGDVPYDPTARYDAGLCPVPGCDGPGGAAGTCDLHFHKQGCASEQRGDEGCDCGLTTRKAEASDD